MRCRALADALRGLWRDDGLYADDAFLLGCFREEGDGNVCLDVVGTDVAGGCAAVFQEGDDVVGIAFGDVECHRNRLFAVERRVGGCFFCCQ